MTRKEHLQWAKDRALEYLGPKPNPTPTASEIVDLVAADMDRCFHPGRSGIYGSGSRSRSSTPDIHQAWASFVSDMGKHDETRNHIAIELGHQMYVGGMLNTASQMRQWIEGFN